MLILDQLLAIFVEMGVDVGDNRTSQRAADRAD